MFKRQNKENKEREREGEREILREREYAKLKENYKVPTVH